MPASANGEKKLGKETHIQNPGDGADIAGAPKNHQGEPKNKTRRAQGERREAKVQRGGAVSEILLVQTVEKTSVMKPGGEEKTAEGGTTKRSQKMGQERVPGNQNSIPRLTQ